MLPPWKLTSTSTIDMTHDKIRCVITDDEPFARKGLEKYSESIDFLEVIALCEDALELNTVLNNQVVDLIFLDINMPHISGLDFLKGLKDPPKVVFTTAYEKYALDGYDLEIVDFLLKPISFERFLKACNKARREIHTVDEPGVSNDHFFIKTDGRIERILIRDILFLESMQNYVKIHTHSQQYITHLTLKSAMEYLAGFAFIQPHKSYFVAMDKIESIADAHIIIGANRIPISRHTRSEVMEQILNNRLLKK